MTLAFLKDESHPMVDALLRTRVPRWRELNRAIDERDDMLDFAMKLFHHDRDAAVTNYFQSALDQFALVRHISTWRPRHPRRMLDFASGYGRLTRLLVHEHLADEITVSDILEGGMAFQSEQFGVRALLSATNPADFVAPERYDLIFVASLFTHLPPATFTTWLRRLADLLEPEGLLIFSVHDEVLSPDKPVDGIRFESSSESRVLDVEDYGSTWVTEDYVRGQVAALGADWACVRMPRALSDWQDVYVISPAPIAEARPRRVPKGFLEEPHMLAEGVRVSGWATTIDAPPERVEVRIEDDVVATTREFLPRADVGAWFGTESAAQSGWACIVPYAAVRSFRYQVLTISAFSSDGDERILFLGTLDSLLGTEARARAQHLVRQLSDRQNEVADLRERLAIAEHQRNTLDQQIAAMKQSRFWKAREQWFAVKRAAGLTEEE
ncbi:MAG: class I SAM-dependent methyltransferase [Acidobacteriota bacterium]|nr:class I SAM-dependent methyltransferase [Acidobacteriota bacterium]